MDNHKNLNRKWLHHQTRLIGNIKTIASAENYVRSLSGVMPLGTFGNKGDYKDMGAEGESDLLRRNYMVPFRCNGTDKVVGIKFIFDRRINMGEMTILHRTGTEMDELLASDEKLRKKIVELMFEGGNGFKLNIKDREITFQCPQCKTMVSHQCSVGPRKPMFKEYWVDKFKEKKDGKEKIQNQNKGDKTGQEKV